jgi:hypothetical protein
MNSVQQKAEELFIQVTQQINEERRKLALLMLDKGYTTDTHVIVDNLDEVIENPTIAYVCYPQPK